MIKHLNVITRKGYVVVVVKTLVNNKDQYPKKRKKLHPFKCVNASDPIF